MTTSSVSKLVKRLFIFVDYSGRVVSQSEPFEKTGTYWGY